MRKRIIICDRCKKEVPDATLHQISDTMMFDLCAGCMEVWSNWLDARLIEWCNGGSLAGNKKEVEQTTEQKPKGKGGRKIELDYDKACALRKAGWSYDKIADELNCGPSTIYRKLHLEGYYEQYLNGARMGGNNNEG